MHIIEADSANDAWCRARPLFYSGDATEVVVGRGGATRDVLHVVFKIRHPSERWNVARTPAINPAFAIADIVWIVTGRDDSGFINRWNSKLPEFAGTGPQYDGAYGERLRTHFGLDQIRRACDTLSSNPTSRQTVLQIWDPMRDLPHPDGNPASPDVPCNVCSLLKLRNGRLEWSQIMRSNDLFLGLPYNFVQFSYLQEILAGCLGAEVGEYCHFSDSLHVYERDTGRLGIVAVNTPDANTDRLNAPLELSDGYFREMAKAIEKLGDTTAREHCRVAMGVQVPEAYRNLVLIVAAEGARRRRMMDQMEPCVQACTNPALKQVWELWVCSRSVTPGERSSGSLRSRPRLGQGQGPQTT